MTPAPMRLTSEPTRNTPPDTSCSTKATTVLPGRAG